MPHAEEFEAAGDERPGEERSDDVSTNSFEYQDERSVECVASHLMSQDWVAEDNIVPRVWVPVKIRRNLSRSLVVTSIDSSFREFRSLRRGVRIALCAAIYMAGVYQ